MVQPEETSNLPVPPSLIAAGIAIGVTYYSDGRRWSMFTMVCCLSYLGRKIYKGNSRQQEMRERISKLEQLFQALKKKALQDRVEHKETIEKLNTRLDEQGIQRDPNPEQLQESSKKANADADTIAKLKAEIFKLKLQLVKSNASVRK